MGTDLVLAKIDRAKQFLAEARNLMDVKNVIALANAAQVYARQVAASVETINRASEIRLRAERRLGELLKETPKNAGAKGTGSNQHQKVQFQPGTAPKPPTLADSGISKKLSSRAQELAAAPVEEFEEALNVPPDKELNPNRVVKDLKEKRQREARQEKRLEAAKDSPESDSRVIVGDFRKHASKVADGSASLIFTDPPYDREASKMLGDLGKFAAAKLADGGSLVLYVGHIQLGEAMDALRKHLRFWWIAACVHSGKTVLMNEYGIRVGWKPVLWFVKGTRDDKSIVVSDVMSGGEEKTHHDWQQSESEAGYWIGKLCPVDGLVCDPFLGGGTTAAAAESLKRKWIGFEVNEDTAAIARKRIAK